MYKSIGVISLVTVISMSGLNISYGGDLDDGISRFTDESINADDSLGKPDININFIVLDAMSKWRRKGKEDNKRIAGLNGSGDSNENSVVVEPGAVIDTIINISAPY